jgi:hypothetical protein
LALAALAVIIVWGMLLPFRLPNLLTQRLIWPCLGFARLPVSLAALRADLAFIFYSRNWRLCLNHSSAEFARGATVATCAIFSWGRGSSSQFKDSFKD